jgi:hypothetical protein
MGTVFPVKVLDRAIRFVFGDILAIFGAAVDSAENAGGSRRVMQRGA